MTAIADGQKRLCIKYKAAMLATAEYRKGLPRPQQDLVLPANDDIADARALTYRPNAIIHIYNDLDQRGDYAQFWWIKQEDPETPCPTLLMIFGKNKITSYKKSLALNLDPRTVTLTPTDMSVVRDNYEDYKKNEGASLQGGRLVVTADVDDLNSEE